MNTNDFYEPRIRLEADSVSDIIWHKKQHLHPEDIEKLNKMKHYDVVWVFPQAYHSTREEVFYDEKYAYCESAMELKKRFGLNIEQDIKDREDSDTVHKIQQAWNKKHSHNDMRKCSNAYHVGGNVYGVTKNGQTIGYINT